MSINQPKNIVPKINIKDIGKQCSALKESIVFSFEHLTENDEYNFNYFKKNNAELLKVYNSFMQVLSRLSRQSWNDLNMSSHRKGGDEMLRVDMMESRFVNSLKHVSMDEKLHVIRFGNYRLFLKRGTKCRRVAQVLAFEFKLGSAYNHG